MRLISSLAVVMVMIVPASRSFAQNKVRTALIAAGGKDNVSETATINELEHGLVADGQIELVDRRMIDRILKEQNLQQTDKIDPSTATQYGRLLGVPTLVFVRFDAYQSAMKSAPRFGGFKWTATVLFQMTALVVDVKTAAILAAPTAKFEKVNEPLKTSFLEGLGQPGQPGQPQQPGPGPKGALEELNKQAFQSVLHELTPELITALRKIAPSAPVAAIKMLKVAGVRGNQTYLNGGSGDAIKAGDRFQIFRMADTGLKDPDNPSKPILERTDVCVLTIGTVSQEKLSSGDCKGSVAKLGDEATAIP